MKLDQNYYPRLNGLRKKHVFDQENKEHKVIEKEALVFRQALYDYAQSLFNSSPKLLSQLSPREMGVKGNGLLLFNSEAPPRLKNAKGVIMRFLIKRADILVHPAEKNNLKLLIDYVNNYENIN